MRDHTIYIVDLLRLRSCNESIAQTQLMVDTPNDLHFGIHLDKAQVITSRSAEFLGTHVNSKKMQF